MKWEGRRQSDHVQDRRGSASSGGSRGGRSLGVGSVVVALVVSYFLGVNPLTVLSILSGVSIPVPQPAPAQRVPADDRMASFVATVLADTEDVWRQIFQTDGSTYREPALVLFRGSTPTACGQGQSAMGPFYCPADQKVYIDLAFYDTLSRRLGAPGDFAQAYVIAHEVAHHVQNLRGITGQMDQMRARLSERDDNVMSVRLELQADCLAGVWAHHAQANRQLLEAGDVDEALNAASRIGDDALQGASGGAVVPDSFTHGTSAQRQRWFKNGLENGSIKRCDTFSATSL